MISPYKEEHLESIKSIFWETSSKQDFLNDKEKDKFEYKYLHYYLEKFPHSCFVYKCDGTVIGYILCEPFVNSNSDVFNTLAYHKEFNDYYELFPSELHINLASSSQGKGVGSKLIKHLVTYLSSVNSSGLFAFTGSSSENISFYTKNGFKAAAQHNSIVMLAMQI